VRRGGEIGRHRRLKISRPKGVTVRVRPAAPSLPNSSHDLLTIQMF